MGMIVGRRWVYSKVGNAWAYYISKRSKYKIDVLRTIFSFKNRYCLNVMNYDKYSNLKYYIITIDVAKDASSIFSHIDNTIIEILKDAGCPKHLCTVKMMKGEGECKPKRKR